MRRKKGFYEKFIKRPQDFLLSLVALIGTGHVLKDLDEERSGVFNHGFTNQ